MTIGLCDKFVTLGVQVTVTQTDSAGRVRASRQCHRPGLSGPQSGGSVKDDSFGDSSDDLESDSIIIQSGAS